MTKLISVTIVLFSLIAVENAFEFQPRISFGFNAPPDQFQYFAYLDIQPFVKYDWLNYKKCGATLISDNWLLTTAHCLSNARYVNIHLGVSKTNKEERFVEWNDFQMHPNYNNSNVLNDIALIRLQKKVQFSNEIHPVQLPTECKTPENIIAYAIGNGVMNVGGSTSKPLKYAMLKTLPFKTCHKIFPALRKRASVLCAYNGVNHQTICNTDFGGPLISSIDNKLIGISSFLGEGAVQGFTNIYSHLNWIKEVTGLNLPSC